MLGAGVGKDGAPDVRTADWCVYGVRGPLSAACLHLEPRHALADPAVLMPLLLPASSLSASSGQTGFMPHIFSADEWNWRSICKAAGLVYIDPHADWRDTTETIAGLSCLVTEAMHGAIVADAYRVPWLPVVISERFDHAKWFDWSSALHLSFRFTAVPSLRAPSAGQGWITGREVVKSALRRTPLRRRVSTWTLEPATTARQADHAVSRLERLAHGQGANLSDPHRLAEAQERLLDAVHQLQVDYAAGRLHERRERMANGGGAHAPPGEPSRRRG